jgi:glycosyltransferase involved in cell wall biosynthesis
MATRLRVLHAIHDFLPRHQAGSEIYAANLAKALQRRGHHVTVLAATYDPTRYHGEAIWRTFDGLPVVEVVNNWTSDGFAAAWAPPELDRVFSTVLDATGPDILHCHNLLNLSLNLPALGRAQGAAVVGTLHDYTLVCPSGGQRIHKAERHVCHTIEPDRCARCFRQSPFHSQMTFGRTLRGTGGHAAAKAATFLRRHAPRLAVRLASTGTEMSRSTGPSPAQIAARLDAAREAFAQFDHIVSPSLSLAREFEALDFPTRRLVVSDYGFVPLGDVLRTPTTAPLRVGFVGTLVWHKGVHVLVDAVRRIPPGRVEVLVFGDPGTFPDYTAELERAARGWPVRFMGRFDHDKPAAVYAQFDVLAVPSIWLENSPLVIHEAFMARLPVVGARIGGIADLIDHGVNGVLVEPDSPEALARALDDLATDRSRLAALASRAPAVKSMDEDARHWEDVYLSLASRPASQSAVS